MTDMQRRSLATSLCRVALAAVLSIMTFGAEAFAGRLFVFGDSYSDTTRTTFPNWVEQLKAAGEVATFFDFAESGATATSSSTRTFFQQINRWRQSGQRFRPGDTTVIYLGYNDIDESSDLTGSRNGYRIGLQALVDAGANASGRRVVLVLPHDWGGIPQKNQNPEARSRLRSRTNTWNNIVRGLRGGRPNIVTADLFALFDKVVANPGSYGLTNVETVDKARSKTTALYNDSAHFGQKGQSIIRKSIGRFVP